MTGKTKNIALFFAIILGLLGLIYIGGLAGQYLHNYRIWLDSGGLTGQSAMQSLSWSPAVCFSYAFTVRGMSAMIVFLLAVSALVGYLRLHDRFGGTDLDPRGFFTSDTGIYGTAGWMQEKELRQVLEITPVEKAEGIILGERNGKAVCMPKDTRLNRHIAVFGASGTMKSRAVIRPNGIYVSLDGGIDCLCRLTTRDRPSRGTRVTVRVLGKDAQRSRLWGVIVYMV